MSANDPSVPIDVDLTRSTNGVWLVKMPKYLSQILNEHADATPNGEIGSLIKRVLPGGKGSVSTAGGARSSDVTFSLNDQIMERLKQQNPSKDFQLPPREHRFCLSNVSDGVLRTVYTRTLSNPNFPSSEQISMVGRVIQRAEVRPVENEQYMSMKRKHIEKSQEPTRQAKMIGKKVNTYAPKRFHEGVRKKKTEGKRIRSSEDAVLRVIFDAFSKNQYISMASLEAVTQQPKNFLQQLVKRYCNYNSAGHTYELKPQFRDYSLNKDDDDDVDEMDDDDDDDDDDNNNNTSNKDFA